MAKITAPFLSLSARGSIGKTLVAGAWKGVKYMRQHVVPANPQSVAQTAQRDIMALCVVAWQTGFETDSIKAGWNYFASVSGKAQSGFNAFVSTTAKNQAANPTAACFISMVTTIGVTLTPVNPDTTAPVMGDYIFRYGDTPDALTHSQTKTVSDFGVGGIEATVGQFVSVTDTNGVLILAPTKILA
ncbi:MAG: DUF6266 family protein [bacterium]